MRCIDYFRMHYDWYDGDWELKPSVTTVVKVSDLWASQSYIDSERLDNLRDDRHSALAPITVTKEADRLIIRNGHHRALLAILEGRDTITANVHIGDT